MIITGLEGLLADSDKYRNRDTALIANHTSVAPALSYSWNELKKKGISLKRIFSPEHGIFGVEQDQVPVSLCELEDFEVVSLYGSSLSSLAPEPELFSGIDTVFFDVQDIGTRYYTYAATLVFFMKALHGSSVELVVLDRPNPLGGEVIEGPSLQSGFESFVGLLPVPVRHGLTVGEMALLARDYFSLDVDLKIIKMQGWKRSMYFHETGLPWVPPSPNMPAVNTALVYPGMCLLEGTNLSEGRGTTCPFEIFGAPYMDTEKLLRHEDIRRLKGMVLRPMLFRPSFNKYVGEVCRGFFMHVTDPEVFDSFRAGVSIVKAVYDTCPAFRFTHDEYEFNTEHPAFDLLTGSSFIREMIESGFSMDKISAAWAESRDELTFFVSGYRLYHDQGSHP